MEFNKKQASGSEVIWIIYQLSLYLKNKHTCDLIKEKKIYFSTFRKFILMFSVFYQIICHETLLFSGIPNLTNWDEICSNSQTDGGSKFTCKICMKSFDRRRHLADHFNTHTGARPYICPYCSQGYKFKANCTRHMRICSVRLTNIQTEMNSDAL